MIKNFKINIYIFYLIMILFLEIIFRLFVFEQFFSQSLIYIFLFSLPVSLLCGILSKQFSEKNNKIITSIIVGIITLLFAGQFIFVTLFSIPFSFSTIGLASQVLDFLDILGTILINNIWKLLILLLPLVVYSIFLKNFNFSKSSRLKLYPILGITLIIYLLCLCSLFPNQKKTYSAYQLYYHTDSPSQIYEKFGVITGMRLDIKRLIFGYQEKLILENNEKNEKTINETPKEQKYNITPIDFNSLIENEPNQTLKSMHTYFASEEATNQNNYTGMFKGKNLIFIIAEGYNEIAVQKDVTPTLYKLTHEGFVFKNFYSPVMLSTVGGEFQALTALVPTQETLESWTTKTPTISYALGNSFAKAGYSAKAYHNWTYTYYSRTQTRPTLGFGNYIGCGNGLEKYMNCKKWPQSDVELIETISPWIIGQDSPTVSYILTVSGHSNYNWTGQNIAAKNKSLVENLPYSETAKAYLATQIELDRALAVLIKNLEAAGELENTVIAMVGDHYPYTMSLDEVNELATYEKDKLFEINHSNFVIWNSKMKTTSIDKIGSQIDVLPTLLNLFGIDYDSRLLVGKDILSDSAGLAIFSNRSWITDKGRYNTTTKTFVANEGVSIDEGYIDKMNAIVANKFTMSKYIIQNNYYEIILGK